MPQAKTGRKPSAKRDAILDAARAIFLDQGYAAASMDSVAAEAGVSKATIYAHFTGKDDLFGAMIRSRCERNATFAPLEAGFDARKTLTVIGQRLLDLLLQPQTLAVYRLVVSEAERHPDLAKAFYESGPGTGRAQIAQMIAELAERGELTVTDPSVVADLFVGMLRTDLFMRSLLGLPQPEGRSVESAIADAVETVLRAYGRRV